MGEGANLCQSNGNKYDSLLLAQAAIGNSMCGRLYRYIENEKTNDVHSCLTQNQNVNHYYKPVIVNKRLLPLYLLVGLTHCCKPWLEGASQSWSSNNCRLWPKIWIIVGLWPFQIVKLSYELNKILFLISIMGLLMSCSFSMRLQLGCSEGGSQRSYIHTNIYFIEKTEVFFKKSTSTVLQWNK